MKLFKQFAEAIGVFSPILILLFACSLYLYQPSANDLGSQIKKDIKIKPAADEGVESYYVLQPIPFLV